MNDKVSCPICFKQFGSLNSHIIRKHKLTINEFREKFPNCQLVSDATKFKTSETSKKNGCGKWRKGSKLTPEQCRAVSIRNSGSGNPFFEKKHTDETKQRMCDNHADFTGDYNPLRIWLNQNEENREQYRQSRRDYWNSLRQNEEKYYAICDDHSKRATQAFLDGKMKSVPAGYLRGYFVSNKLETPIFYRSSYEKKFLELCHDSASVTAISTCKFSIPYKDGKRKRRYIPDFLINDKILVEIKAKFALSDEIVQIKIIAGHEYSSYKGWKFIVITNVEEQFEDLCNLIREND